MSKTFTLKELAQYDGKQGRPAYAAVDGTVYDLSGSAAWREGHHSLCHLSAQAGRDLSEEIKDAPDYMRDMLARKPVVGRLVTGSGGRSRSARTGLAALAVVLFAVPFVSIGVMGVSKYPASWTALRTIAMVAFTALFLDVVIGAYRPLLNRLYKAGPLQRLHEGIAACAFTLGLVHGIMALSLGIAGYKWVMWFGPVVLAVLIVTISVAKARERLVQSWRWIHRINFVLFALILAKAYLIGANLATQTFLKVIFLVYAGVAAIGLIYRLGSVARRPAA